LCNKRTQLCKTAKGFDETIRILKEICAFLIQRKSGTRSYPMLVHSERLRKNPYFVFLKTKHMKILKITFSLLLTLHLGAYAQNTPEESTKNERSPYEEALTEMLQISGANANFKIILEQMLPMLQQQNKKLSKEAMERVKARFIASSISELTTLSIPSYQKHLDLYDLKQVIEFYQTLVSKKYAEKTTLIAQESLQISQQWAVSLPYKFKQIANEVGK
jgi:hypothetical protein